MSKSNGKGRGWRRWSIEEENLKKREMNDLYVEKNLSMNQIAEILHVGSTVYSRLMRLGIESNRSGKLRYNNKRQDVSIPEVYSLELAELVGVLLGDGHLSPTQVMVTLGTKEERYVNYVAKLISKVFNVDTKIILTRDGHRTVYFGSTDAIRYFQEMGLVSNKVKYQVQVPEWIFTSDNFMKSFLKGFFDTDGSVYLLRYGIQIAYTNRSTPLLVATQRCLVELKYHPSKISNFKVYLTRREEIVSFFSEIDPANIKHKVRFEKFVENMRR